MEAALAFESDWGRRWCLWSGREGDPGGRIEERVMRVNPGYAVAASLGLGPVGSE